MTKGFFTIMLLVVSNVFMTIAWYGHLKFQEWGWLKKTALWSVILISWGLPCSNIFSKFLLTEWDLKKMAFSLFQLKVIQEVITLLVFTVFTIIFFKTESLKWNHLAAFFCLILAVYFVFKK
jgi:uncharacterized protein (DUF486 family)